MHRPAKSAWRSRRARPTTRTSPTARPQHPSPACSRALAQEVCRFAEAQSNCPPAAVRELPAQRDEPP
eukprot:7151679-Alexandrium_andersonii.AAC.1